MSDTRSRIVAAVRPWVRRGQYVFADALDRLKPQRDEVGLPPKTLQRLNGSRDFDEMGRAIAIDVAACTGMGKGSRVLDVGCGVGRFAIPCAEIIGPGGTYDGIEVVGEAVSWCRRRVTPIHPNIRFHRADVYSHHYNRSGSQQAADYRFPFDEGSFDVIVVTSVFTHLGADATENYLSECARVLDEHGRLFATFFLIDEYSRSAIESRKSTIEFFEAGDGSFVKDHDDPGAAVAHDLDWVTTQVLANGLAIDGEPRWGTWNSRPGATRQQDVLIAEKRQPD